MKIFTLILVAILVATCTYVVGNYIVIFMKNSGVLILWKDYLSAYTIPLCFSAFILLFIWASLCDKYNWE